MTRDGAHKGPGRRADGRGQDDRRQNDRRPDDRRQDGPRRAGPKGRRNAIGADPRRVAYDVLRAVSQDDAYANLVLPTMLREAGLPTRDAALATELAYGTLRATGTLDAVIDVVSSRPLDTLDPDVLDAVRLGVYQLLRTRVATHAAVSATVGATYGILSQGQAGFVNALLRKVSHRGPEEWIDRVAPDPAQDRLGYLAVAKAHPPWIARAFLDALGGDLDETERALDADDARPGVHLVARPGRIERDDLAQRIDATPGRFSPYAVYLESGDPGSLVQVRSGSAAVQDEGSQLAALALANAPLDGPDRLWVDLCAGPGGKAALLASIAAGRDARLVAIEPAPHRARLVQRALAGLPATTLIADGRTPPLADGSADRVLVDAPCSGLGALRRRPEARWRRTPGDLPPLTALQRQLLGSALSVVRPGGVVAYVTCSPHLAETRQVVRSMIEDRGELLDVRQVLPSMPDLGDGPWVQLWPHLHGTDAMFISLIRRTGS
ncbi:16S rRNA (cytosine967-C5)-methyltransferase [Antricoccus suffuscus]|uniref:16S rRNA (Cytosine967-C5)-methyltransferase n=1 Tax=Antricoccus suffuscus TaxID=1629062 RepID=A0A2T0ZWE1_9ACTN|nr:transcription antitermination factor NusB [Antricoccus suffuscus]PRZ40660.1 16S rRNA (cytosine967-C5)-methyltransferase [Antricoccus suffuscus]